MASAITRTGEIPGAMTARPDDEELDLFGITHAGKVRKDNQDHYLIGTLHQTAKVHGTSLPNIDQLPLRGRRLGTFALVADGVGGSADGSEAARLASETVMRYVTSTLQCYHASSDAGTTCWCAPAWWRCWSLAWSVRASTSGRSSPGYWRSIQS